MTSLVSAIMIGGYIAQALTLPRYKPTPGVSSLHNCISEVWSFSTLAFDIITTFSTIVYLFCARKDLNARPGILAIVWQVLWASATPPLVLVIISLVDHMIPGPDIVAIIAIAMMGKIYVLSLMINIVGQGYIRQQFERRWTPSLHGGTWGREQAGRTYNVDRSMVHVTVHTGEIEFTTATISTSRNIGYEGSTEDELGRGITDAISLKDGDALKPYYTTHNIKLTSERGP
ncbi:unnamed protein product [Rhizoctonia solani]|nr:unnamed protein product [Rhizoctonia solani]